MGDESAREYYDIVSKTFASEDDAFEFYNSYAHEKGFSVRKSYVEWDEANQKIILRKLVCSRQDNNGKSVAKTRFPTSKQNVLASPHHLLNMKQPSGLEDDYVFEESIPVITKGQTREYTFKVYRLLVNLDLSSNSLTGQIPEEISFLIRLTNLNLSSNQLIGKIPNQIGDLKQLESLDLSYNELTGEIPSGLSDLTSLSYLNLSYNNLSGAIPSGPQLQTLDSQIDIYIGNLGLCGYPLSKNCSTSTTGAGQSVGHEDADHVAPLYLGMCIGFVVGLWT
ncbi:hypothetical protein ACQ4PT_003965 [Festuca glaucescens]